MKKFKQRAAERRLEKEAIKALKRTGVLFRHTAPRYPKLKVANDIANIRSDIESILATEPHTIAEVVAVDALVLALTIAEPILLGTHPKYTLPRYQPS